MHRNNDFHLSIGSDGVVNQNPDFTHDWIRGHGTCAFNEDQTLWGRRRNIDDVADAAWQLGAVSFEVSVPLRFNIAMEPLPGANGLAITWPTIWGLDYSLESKSNLITQTTWTSNTTVAGTGEDVTVTAAVDQVQSFYRVTAD